MSATLPTLHNAARETRRLIRAGLLNGHTPGHVQGNVAIAPGVHTADSEPYCRRNAQACPLLAMSHPGDLYLPTLRADVDMRTDLLHAAALLATAPLQHAAA